MHDFERANEISFFVLYVCDTTVVFFKLPYTPFGNKCFFIDGIQLGFHSTGKCVNSDYDEVFIFIFVNIETVTVFTLSYQTPYEIKIALSIASFTVFQFTRDFC